MENELSNIKVENYSVKFVPAVIKINGIEKLASLIDSNISKYQNLAVTADNVKDAKKIKANLNKLKKAKDNLIYAGTISDNLDKKRVEDCLGMENEWKLNAIDFAKLEKKFRI